MLSASHPPQAIEARAGRASPLVLAHVESHPRLAHSKVKRADQVSSLRAEAYQSLLPAPAQVCGRDGVIAWEGVVQVVVDDALTP